MLKAADFGNKGFSTALAVAVSGDVTQRFHKTVRYSHLAANQAENTPESENQIRNAQNYGCILRVSFSSLWNNCSHTCSKFWSLHDPEGHPSPETSPRLCKYFILTCSNVVWLLPPAETQICFALLNCMLLLDLKSLVPGNKREKKLSEETVQHRALAAEGFSQTIQNWLLLTVV